jgi:hypothetical protein
VSASHPSRPPLNPARTAVRYGLSALSVGVAVLLMLAVNQFAGSYDARPALLLAIAVSALYAGLGPGGLALALATLASRDPVLLVTGAALVLVCSRFRPAGARRFPSEPSAPMKEARSPRGPAVKADGANGSAPQLEVTTEATWRFHHEQPLDITLPEDEQVDHLYMYSVLAECNDAFARMYGFRTAADVVGTRLVVFLPPSNPENVAYLRTFIRSGYRLEDAKSHEIDRYGQSKHFVNNLVGIFERGLLAGAWGTQRDVTDDRSQEYSSRVHSSKSSSQ